MPAGNLPLILASGSASRLKLLESVKIFPDEVISTDVDETRLKHEKPQDYCNRVAKLKFEAALAMLPNRHSVVIAADSTAICGGKFLDKTFDKNQIRSYLKMISGKRHRVITSILCGIINDGTIVALKKKLVISILIFKPFEEKEIEYLVESEEGMGKCGGYQISGLASRYVRFISGSFSNIAGLPLYETTQMLSSLGYKLI